MDEFIKAMFDRFGKTPEEVEAQMQDQIRELVNQVLGPPDSPARKMLEGALGMGRNAVDEKFREAAEAALKAKDKVIDGLLEYMHSKGLKPEEDIMETTTDDIPVADVPKDWHLGDAIYADPAKVNKLVEMLRAKGILGDDDLI